MFDWSEFPRVPAGKAALRIRRRCRLARAMRSSLTPPTPDCDNRTVAEPRPLLGSGHAVDIAARSERVTKAAHIARWCDSFRSDPDETETALPGHPDRDPAFGLTERRRGTNPWPTPPHRLKAAAAAILAPVRNSFIGRKAARAWLTRMPFDDDGDRRSAALLRGGMPCVDLPGAKAS